MSIPTTGSAIVDSALAVAALLTLWVAFTEAGHRSFQRRKAEADRNRHRTGEQ